MPCNTQYFKMTGRLEREILHGETLIEIQLNGAAALSQFLIDNQTFTGSNKKKLFV